MITRGLFTAPLVAMMIVVMATPIPAQVTTGTIVGTVIDSSGVVPGRRADHVDGRRQPIDAVFAQV
jgi:hypothetical protein